MEFDLAGALEARVRQPNLQNPLPRQCSHSDDVGSAMEGSPRRCCHPQRDEQQGACEHRQVFNGEPRVRIRRRQQQERSMRSNRGGDCKVRQIMVIQATPSTDRDPLEKVARQCRIQKKLGPFVSTSMARFLGHMQGRQAFVQGGVAQEGVVVVTDSNFADHKTCRIFCLIRCARISESATTLSGKGVSSMGAVQIARAAQGQGDRDC